MEQNVLVWVQIIGAFLILAELVLVLKREARAVRAMFLVLFGAMLNTVGYALELQATTCEAALRAVKLIYIGKPFIALGMLLFILHYCHISYQKFLLPVLFALHASVTVCVLTCEQNPLFYTSICFVSDGGKAHLSLGHGVLYQIYTVVVLVEAVVMIAACLWRRAQTREKKEQRLYAYLCAIPLLPFVLYPIYASGITHGYDITAPGYILSTVILVVCTRRYDLLDTLSIARDRALDNLIDGIVVLNNSDEILYQNAIARTLCPELSDRRRPKNELVKLRSYIEEKQLFFSGREVYQLREEELAAHGMTVGRMIVIENNTKDFFYTTRLQADVKEKTRELERLNGAILSGLANMVEMRDDITGTHIKNTSCYVTALCEELRARGCYAEQLSDEAVQNMVAAAPLHDVGKVAIPDSILCKQGRLTEEEFAVIKTHPTLGRAIIKQMIEDAGESPVLHTAKDMASYHHERWDGNGYPTGRKGEEIPLSARIMAVADVYDALRSKRSYKEPMPKQQALDIIAKGAGTQFDPVLAKVFVSMMQRQEDSIEKPQEIEEEEI